MSASLDNLITGLGPHGERASSPSRIVLSQEDLRVARARRFSVGVVFHTLESDWSRQSMAGIVGTLGRCGANVTEVVDCRFEAHSQIDALQRMSCAPVDAVISIPVANETVAEAYRWVSEAGKRLILHDNVPTGLLPGRDYTSLISADNFGLGLIGAELLSAHVAEGSDVGLLTYEVDFYATNEREIAFSRWMKANRPDLRVRTRRFPSPETAGRTTEQLIAEFPRLAGLFAVWDDPAMRAINVLRRQRRTIPVTTVDLGREISIELARNGHAVGIAAQQPHAQGVAVAQATILSLLGAPVPSWIALPGLAVTKENVIESYQQVWSAPAPPEILLGKR